MPQYQLCYFLIVLGLFVKWENARGTGRRYERNIFFFTLRPLRVLDPLGGAIACTAFSNRDLLPNAVQ